MTTGRRDSIFGQFGETARCRDAQHGDGVCCAFAPQLVLSVTAHYKLFLITVVMTTMMIFIQLETCLCYSDYCNKFAGAEFAGPENDGPKKIRLENAGPRK